MTNNVQIPVTPELLTDAALFAGLVVALGVLSLVVSRERRQGFVGLALLSVIVLGGLALLGRYGAGLGSGTAYDIAREALLALLAVAVIRAAVLFLARVVCARLRVPQILVDVLFALGMIAYAIYRLNAAGVNLAGVVTTSAIVTGALAFSAGETLANVWAGLALQLENTLRIGDWVRSGDRIGQIVGIRWRSTVIATLERETVVVPNSALMKDRIVVLGRAGETLFRREVSFQVDFDYAPSAVIRVVGDALRAAELPNVASDPPPACVCRSFGDSGIVFAAFYHPLDLADLFATDSRVLATIFATLQREGMPIPLPQQVVELRRRSRERAVADREARLNVVDSMELFHGLVDEERAIVAASLVRMPYASGEKIFRKGDEADSLFILASGRVGVMEESAEGGRMPLAHLTAPAYFGEMGLLTGQPRFATVIAEDDVVCYRLGKEAFDAVLRDRPEIADSLAHVLAARQAENDATLKTLDADARARHTAKGALEILRRIRHFFALPPRH